MKKYVNPSPIPNGGMPIFAGDFIDCLQSEVYRAITAGYKSLNEPLIIYGCAVSNIDTLAGTCDISSGMAYLDGDMIDVSAHSGAYPVYLVQGASTVVSKNYKDQTPRPVLVTKTTTWSNAAPTGGSEGILFDPYTSQYLKDIQRRVNTPINRCEWFPDFPNAASFDVNGLGKWEWLGYHVANGLGGTKNMTGCVPAQYSSEDPDFAIGAKFGEKLHLLIEDEMPSHTHPYTKPHGDGSASGNAISHPDGPLENAESGSSGGDQAHNNMQPTVFGVWLQRRPY